MILASHVELKIYRQLWDFDSPNLAEADGHRVHPMHHSLNLECPKSGFQNAADIERVNSINPDTVNVLTDVYLAVIACHCNAPSDQGLRPTKSIVSEKDILCGNPAALRVIVTSFGNPVWLDRR